MIRGDVDDGREPVRTTALVRVELAGDLRDARSLADGFANTINEAAARGCEFGEVTAEGGVVGTADEMRTLWAGGARVLGVTPPDEGRFYTVSDALVQLAEDRGWFFALGVCERWRAVLGEMAEAGDAGERAAAGFLLGRVRDAITQIGGSGEKCGSGWTGDRCAYPLHHGGPHSNESRAGEGTRK